MDGVGQYVTVRREFFAATSLVASATAATLPVTLAPPNTSPSVATANEVGRAIFQFNRVQLRKAPSAYAKAFSSQVLQEVFPAKPTKDVFTGIWSRVVTAQ